MDHPKRLKVSSNRLYERISRENSGSTVTSVQKPKVSEVKHSFSSLATELQLGIVQHLPRTSLPTICQLNKHWRRIGTDELLQRLLPIPPLENGCALGEVEDLRLTICHFIDTNNADALQHLLDFRPKHPYFCAPITSCFRPSR